MKLLQFSKQFERKFIIIWHISLSQCSPTILTPQAAFFLKPWATPVNSKAIY